MEMRTMWTMMRRRHNMRQILGACLYEIPAPAKAEPLLGDMETSVPHFFFFSFLDMNL